MGASRPPLSIADTAWVGLHNHRLSPCPLAGADQSLILSRHSLGARRATHVFACTGPRSY